MSSPSKYLLQPSITPIPILPQTQTAPTTPFRSNVETLNSATPLLPEKEESFFTTSAEDIGIFPGGAIDRTSVQAIIMDMQDYGAVFGYCGKLCWRC